LLPLHKGKHQLTIPRGTAHKPHRNTPLPTPHKPLLTSPRPGTSLPQRTANVIRGAVLALVAVGIVPEAAAVGAAGDAAGVADGFAGRAGGRGIGAEGEDGRAAAYQWERFFFDEKGGGRGAEGEGDEVLGLEGEGEGEIEEEEWVAHCEGCGV